MKTFRFILLSMYIFLCSSCVSGIYELVRGYDNYVETNLHGRKELKKKKFKDKFEQEMSEQIVCDKIYHNYFEDNQINYVRHSYFRFFKSGQFAYFSSSKKIMDFDNLDKANFIGYYVIDKNAVKIETPTGNFNTAHFRVVWNYNIRNNSLKESGKETKYNLKRQFDIDSTLRINEKIRPTW